MARGGKSGLERELSWAGGGGGEGRGERGEGGAETGILFG